MSDRIVLRRVYALDPNTGGFIAAGNSLITDGRGGTTWSGVLDSLSTFGGPMVSFLPSTLSSFSTITYINSSNIDVLQRQLSNTTADVVTAGLGTLGYISSLSLQSSITSTVAGLGSVYISTGSLQSSFTSTVAGLGSVYISTGSLQSSLTSTVAGLGSMLYISTLSLESTVRGLGSLGYISTITAPVSFQSTVAGLGSSGYVSTLSVESTVKGLGSSGYVSTLSIESTVKGLGSSGYVSTLSLESTVKGLGSSGYLSSLALNIRYDNAGNVSIVGGSNTNIFTNVGTIYYVSTFYQSSMTYSGAQPGVELRGNVINNSNMEFSTATIRLDAFSNFTNSNSRITIEAYPTLLFSKLGTGSAIISPLCFPISTMLKYGNDTLLYNTTTTNYLFAANGKSIVSDPASLNGIRFIDSSNVFQQPIRISVPQNTVLNYESNYSLYHYMPGAINYAANQTALHSNTFTPYFGSTGSIFVSIQNSV